MSSKQPAVSVSSVSCATKKRTVEVEVPMAQQVARWLLCLIGILLALYAYYVETTKELNPDYRAMCDIGKSISCSKVFTSNAVERESSYMEWLLTYHPVTYKYGRGFGLIAPIFGEYSLLNQPNSVFGVIFYCLQIIFGYIFTPGAALFLIVTAVLANFGSVYLGYILVFILEDFCVVCISTYIVNFLLLVLNVIQWRYIKNHIVKKTN